MRVGIVQGRLSPPPRDRIQAFPWRDWEGEFGAARSLGFDAIEWLVEEEDRNPIWSDDGRRAIRALSAHHAVDVSSVCADVFLARPLHRGAEPELLRRLIDAAAGVGVRVVLIPVLEEAEIRDEREAEELAAALRECAPLARERGVRLGVETELPAADYVALLERVGDDAVGAYYDTGNAAARGYDCAADLRALGPRVYGVHLKDRELGGGTVPLGEGAVDFPAVLHALEEIGYDGTLVVQGAVGPDYLALAARYRRFVEDAAA